MIENTLISAALFQPHSLQFPNAWVGHLPFAAWVMQEISPKIFVELGTHSGNSYFSFCQSVVEAELSTKCYAVDTWQGDEHAGQYNDEIFNTVNAQNQERFSGFSRLLRMTFDDAVTYFNDGSIDMLHIDGLHTYEAVKHDFETWLPKLAPNAIVMFHDTNVRERNFGVWKLWEELQAKYPNHLEFVHSHGLGILQLNLTQDAREFDWLETNSDIQQRLIPYFSSLGARQLQRFDLNEKKQYAGNLQKLLDEQEKKFEQIKQVLVQQENLIASISTNNEAARNEITQLHQSAMIQAETIERLNENIINLNSALIERDSQITKYIDIVSTQRMQISTLHKTSSWRITAPLRVVAHQFKRVR
jgi:hypothetical protein